jgi:hypothetical protein
MGPYDNKGAQYYHWNKDPLAKEVTCRLIFSAYDIVLFQSTLLTLMRSIILIHRKRGVKENNGYFDILALINICMKVMRIDHCLIV